MTFARLRLVALLTLVSLASVLWLQGFGPHTDDGCATETHCLACRTSFVRPSSAPAPLDLTPALIALHDVHALPSAFTADLLPTGCSSRGPPLSA